MSFLKQIFTWWNGQTLGTRFHTWRHGQRVGEDGVGNIYYQSADGVRRWVIYNGEAQASAVSPEWHGWLHHTWQEPPTQRPHTPRRMGEAAQPELHRDRRRLSPAGLDRACRAAQRAAGLRTMDAGLKDAGDGASAGR
jgi:NADH:ubiquinone oxidoreductase subunit